MRWHIQSAARSSRPTDTPSPRPVLAGVSSCRHFPVLCLLVFLKGQHLQALRGYKHNRVVVDDFVDSFVRAASLVQKVGGQPSSGVIEC